MSEILTVTDLKKVYGKGGSLTRALDGVSLSLEAGDWTAGSMDLCSRSGDIDLALPAELGFTLTFDTTSGDAELEMACLRPSQNVYVWGDGACSIGVNTISGGLEVESW